MRPRMLRPAYDVGGGGSLDNAAGVHHRQTIGQT